MEPIKFVAANFRVLGYLVVRTFATSWLASFGIYCMMSYHKIGSA